MTLNSLKIQKQILRGGGESAYDFKIQELFSLSQFKVRTSLLTFKKIFFSQRHKALDGDRGGEEIDRNLLHGKITFYP